MKTKKYQIRLTAQYKKSYKKIAKRGFNMAALDAVVHQLASGERLGHKYKDHALKGKYKNHRECHIAPDWLLIYTIENDILVLTFVDTGSHADLFSL